MSLFASKKYIQGLNRTTALITNGSLSLDQDQRPQQPLKRNRALDPIVPSRKWVHINQVTPKSVSCISCLRNFNGLVDLWTHDVDCFRYFLKERQNNKHMIQGYEQWQERTQRFRFPCTFADCSNGFGNIIELRDHLKRVHVDDAPYQCRLCLLSFYEVEEISEHLLDKHRIDPWSETKRVCYADAISKIQQTMTELPNLEPASIGENSSGGGLRRASRNSQDLDYISYNYDANYNNATLKKISMFGGRGRTNSTSSMPGRTQSPSLDEDDISRHITYHNSPEGYFTCRRGSCALKFSDERHSFVHEPCFKPRRFPNNREVWQCDFELSSEGHRCGKRFDSKFLLQQHTGHHLQRRYECTICGHLFATSAQARQHVKAHSLRHFECSICSTPFVSRQALNKHASKHHQGQHSASSSFEN